MEYIPSLADVLKFICQAFLVIITGLPFLLLDYFPHLGASDQPNNTNAPTPDNARAPNNESALDNKPAPDNDNAKDTGSDAASDSSVFSFETVDKPTSEDDVGQPGERLAERGAQRGAFRG